MQSKLKIILLRVIEKCFKEIYAWNKRTGFSDKCILILVGLIVMCTFTSILRLEPVVKELGIVAYYVLVIVAVSKFLKLIKDEK